MALVDSGVDLHAADAALADERGVSALGWFRDPAGFRHEISFARRQADTPFESPHAVKFVTGDNGLGHLVFMVPDMQAVSDFSSTCWAFVIPTMWKPVPAYVLCTVTLGITRWPLLKCRDTEVCIT